jgi:tetratricopeptide (TPR) repeat protein
MGNNVVSVLNFYIEGHTGTGDLPIEELVSVLLTKTQFYLPEHSQATAEKIISAFVTKLRAAYVADPQVGIPYIANRVDSHASQQQAGFAAVEQHIQELKKPVTAENLKWHVAKAEALVATRKYSKALQVLTSAQRQFPGNAQVLLNLAELYELTADHDNAALAYEEALQNATGGDELRVRYEYGGFCLNRQEYSRAVDLWRPLVDRQKPNSLLDHYMVALYTLVNWLRLRLSQAASKLLICALPSCSLRLRHPFMSAWTI